MPGPTSVQKHVQDAIVLRLTSLARKRSKMRSVPKREGLVAQPRVVVSPTIPALRRIPVGVYIFGEKRAVVAGTVGFKYDDINSGQTLGFALAEGLARGLTRYPNPPSRLYGTTHFWMNVGESVLCLTVDTSRALDLVQMGVG